MKTRTIRLTDEEWDDLMQLAKAMGLRGRGELIRAISKKQIPLGQMSSQETLLLGNC
ncbi:MAG: ribbon-helix-helix protein, CopG family [Nostoc sp. JL23]|nr:ribbon-helix-helix protein, CopG family [Nostoc sp. JL23]